MKQGIRFRHVSIYGLVLKNYTVLSWFYNTWANVVDQWFDIDA